MLCDPLVVKVAAVIGICVVVIAAVVAGLLQAGGDETPAASDVPTQEEALASLEGSPPRLAAIHRQADALLPGGRAGLKSRIATVRGYPVVVNFWASWCGPCRIEMPVIQKVSAARGKSVAFLGVNVQDNRDAARRFSNEFPVTYPSYEDPNGRVFNSYGLAGAPSTVFYTPKGRQEYIHSGPYRSVEDLNRDIDRYALGK
jgi:cytochrome c biogenesis protein CcmG/thiol:disulfide interchange protein DsbE